MALSNKDRQARWRDKRNEAAKALHGGTVGEFVEAVLLANGVKRAKRLAAALAKRLAAIDPKCKGCKGTGYLAFGLSTGCGEPIMRPNGERWTMRRPCDCDPETVEALLRSADKPAQCNI